MNKILLVLATLALISFAQNNENDGEVVIQNVEVEVATVIPEQEVQSPETIVNLPEADIVEEVIPPVQETTVVEETNVVEQTIVVESEQSPPEDVTIVEENVVVEAGGPGETIVVIEEVDVIPAEQPNVEDVTIVEQEVVVEENVIVVETEAPVQNVTIVEQTIVNEEGDAGDTVVIIEEVVAIEETILEIPDLNGEEITVSGDVSGSASGTVTVGNWTWSTGNDAKVAVIPVALLTVAAGFLVL